MTFWFSVFLFSVSFFISVSWHVYFCCFRQLQSCTFELLFTFRSTKHTCRTDKLYILSVMFKIQLECPLDWCVSGTLFIDFWLSMIRSVFAIHQDGMLLLIYLILLHVDCLSLVRLMQIHIRVPIIYIISAYKPRLCGPSKLSLLNSLSDLPRSSLCRIGDLL